MQWCVAIAGTTSPDRVSIGQNAPTRVGGMLNILNKHAILYIACSLQPLEFYSGGFSFI